MNERLRLRAGFYQYNDSRIPIILTAVPLDLILSPIHRIDGQEPASLPGFLAITPPRKAARGREQDRLVVYLLLTGNATFSSAEYIKLTEAAAVTFYKSAGTLTSALRAAAEAVNQPLLERNMSTSGRGQYVVGWLALTALRESQCTFLLSGPMHVHLLGSQERSIHEPGLSGKGLGVNQASPYYFTQTTLQPNDRILLAGKIPTAWESMLAENSPASLQATRRRLITLTSENLNAVFMQATIGPGALTVVGAALEANSVLQAAPPINEAHPSLAGESEPATPAHKVQPSAYSIPPAPAPARPSMDGDGREWPAREFPASIPRAKPRADAPVLSAQDLPSLVEQPAFESLNAIEAPTLEPGRVKREPSARARRAAKTVVGGMQAWRRATDRLNQGLQKFLPRLLPGAEAGGELVLPSYVMTALALMIPLVVVTVASVVYFQYGHSLQYDSYIQKASAAREQAVSLSDPLLQRDAWQAVQLAVENAERYRKTDETTALGREAESNLDALHGITRLQFNPAFSNGLDIDISRMAAAESDLYLLDARTGEVLHAQLTSRGFQLDMAFNCTPGPYGAYQVGPLVDILALPLLNSVNASVVGTDAAGNLLYCAPGQVPQAIPLPTPSTNWGRVTAITLTGDNLYVLDAPSRAVWVYAGRDSTFVDQPYFFFGGQIPEIQDGIDLAVNGDDLYLLHADGHLSTCSYSHIEAVPTRCQDPAILVNPFTAYQDTDLFAQTHITQMILTSLPDLAVLLLDADNQSVLRFSPRSLELQNQLRPTSGASNPLPGGTIGAIAAGPNHVLYLAIKDEVYFATDMP
jgi:hypothetical protein